MNIPGFNLTLGDDQRWTTGAACASPEGPAPMFPHPADADGIAYAKAICARCPIVATCLEEALANHEAAGIWGGLTTDERRAVARKRAARKARAARKTPSIPPRQPHQKHRKDIDGAQDVQVDEAAAALL